MGRAIALAMSLAMLSACALPLNYQASRHALTLANDPDAPELALLEHRLYREFTTMDVDATVCAAQRIEDGSVVALPAEQEERLILRFPQLAPFARCTLQGDFYRDVDADRPARVVEFFALQCDSAARCTGSAGWRPGAVPYAHTEYTMEFDGYWRIVEDFEPIILT